MTTHTPILYWLYYITVCILPAFGQSEGFSESKKEEKTDTINILTIAI
jgi:hypothetical protein